MCSVQGCNNRATARGWCPKHYARWRKSGDPLKVHSREQHPPYCMIVGCDKPYSSRGYCKTHYERWRRYGSTDERVRERKPPRLCTIEGCGRKHLARGLCSMHTRRLQKHGDPNVARVSKRTQFDCSVPGCDEPAKARHLCSKHYGRWRNNGDPMIDRRGQHAFRATLSWLSLEDVARLDWRADGRGYKWGTWPEHPNGGKTGKLAEHTAVMAAVLGRPIRAGETVHHKNGIRDDNRPENLEIWISAHHRGQRVSELIAWAHELLERYRDDLPLWPDGLRP